MKKYKFLVMLFALIGLATSCSQDDSINLQNTGNNRVVMNASLDAETLTSLKSGPATRGASGDLQLDGYSLRYILEVFQPNNNNTVYREEKLVSDATQAVVFDFTLSNAAGYCALLWADYVAGDAAFADGHYADLYYKTDDVNGLRAISLISSTYAVNTASRDAFFGKHSFTKEPDKPANLGSVELKRPFGRINIIEKDGLMQEELTSMDISYDVPSTFDVLDGRTVSGTHSVSVSGITVFPAATTEKANLFFDYIFAPATGQQLLGEMSIDYQLASGEDNSFTIPANMPVERNKRTNISGYILSIPVDPTATSISVEIDDTWTDPGFEFEAPAVGSYYYEGGSFSQQYIPALTCLGVVFHVDDTQKHGLIVGLEQTKAQWSTVEAASGTNIQYTGPENLSSIKGWGQWQDRYPAFKWCVDQCPEWYIPTVSELQLLGENSSAVNIALEAAGADVIDVDARLWSSAESGTPNSYFVFKISQKWTYGNISKTESNNVHIVRAF